MSPFSNFIGQDAAVRKLNALARAQNAGAPSRHPLLASGRGLGKTTLMRGYAASLTYTDPSGELLVRDYREVNSAVLKNCRYFFENFLAPYSICDSDITVGFDEAHKLPEDIQVALLTILNTEKSPIISFDFNGVPYVFDFTRLSFVFATTDTQKIAKPLVERMNTVALRKYTQEELMQIVQTHAPTIDFRDNILEEIATTVRFNARQAAQRAADVLDHCSSTKQTVFGADDWKSVCHEMSIYPLGLEDREVEVLRTLRDISDSRGVSLTQLAAAANQSREAVQHDIELILLSLNLIKIDGKRFITQKGRDILTLIDKNK